MIAPVSSSSETPRRSALRTMFSRFPGEEVSSPRPRRRAPKGRIDQAVAGVDQGGNRLAAAKAPATLAAASAWIGPIWGVPGPGYRLEAAMRLIVTEKNNSAKKIADILSGGTAKEDASFKTPYYTWEGDDGPADRDRAQGPRAESGLPRGLQELAADRSARPDRRAADQAADRQERRQGDQEGRQGRRRPRDRDRLRPRGRADRPRGAARRSSRPTPSSRPPRACTRTAPRSSAPATPR